MMETAFENFNNLSEVVENNFPKICQLLIFPRRNTGNNGKSTTHDYIFL
jgi:hypothetical protein